MKNQWLTFLAGRVLVKAEGKGIERLINRLAQSGLIIWKVKRQKSGGVHFYIALPDVHKLRHAARKADCSLSFQRGEGIPFLWKRTRKNGGFLIGIFMFFLVAAILSNMTWGIHITGADPETEHKIRKELTNLGIKVGTFHLLSDKPNTIQRKLTERIDNITWVGVELKGTTYQFQVVQKTEPDKIEMKSPGHLVATKKAIIANMFVEKGIPLVKIHQYVDKGQILVSGTIGKEDKHRNISAQGKIWGITWYKTSVEYPLKRTLQVYNGAEKRKHSLKAGSVSLPFWGFGPNKYRHSETEIINHDLFFLGWKLPFVYSEKTIREKEEMQRTLTKREAIEAGKILAKKDLEVNIPADAQLDKEYILHEEVVNGKVKLIIIFQVIENIAMEKPIIQGD
ncbi:sporulation protein YqfD [Lederbergia citrea]|uniref:Sporulation protein YqfD n=1 Tax=Lederbergia citrea TaxID=2833581 RepID=A0A942Z3E8_9BACI|nr:sporulation protein YqfD [Lederbergia citrea]MBS4176293.1 sporulation protein YqfD [Lederbergia citrea]MBS4202854.1 sporulation protein YqfD [Lederbergia citrea]MBS4222479.1 sporulation protein YqfD [Lederbergia citrea]